jgi:hypothetical protein
MARLRRAMGSPSAAASLRSVQQPGRAAAAAAPPAGSRRAWGPAGAGQGSVSMSSSRSAQAVKVRAVAARRASVERARRPRSGSKPAPEGTQLQPRRIGEPPSDTAASPAGWRRRTGRRAPCVRTGPVHPSGTVRNPDGLARAAAVPVSPLPHCPSIWHGIRAGTAKQHRVRGSRPARGTSPGGGLC